MKYVNFFISMERHQAQRHEHRRNQLYLPATLLQQDSVVMQIHPVHSQSAHRELHKYFCTNIARYYQCQPLRYQMPCILLAANVRHAYNRISMDQCHIRMSHGAVAWTSNVTYVGAIGLRGLRAVLAKELLVP